MRSIAATAALLAASFPGGHALSTPQISQRDTLAYSPPDYPSPWMDPQAAGWADAYAKAKDFVSQLTLLEKVNLTTGVGWEGDVCVGNVGSVPRLGLRSLCMQDGPVGVRLTDYNSVFPTGQTGAATWSRDLMKQRGAAIAAEHKGKGVSVLLAPVAGPLGRAPEGGRNWEGFSPDPYLTGVGIAETIQGMQGEGIIACAKHFIGNEQEHFRQSGEAQGYGFNITESISSNIDDKTMHELYLWPFADAVRAGVGSIMCSYNQVNNSYSCQNSKLLNGLLKGELGFQGFVMSDWQAQHTGAASAVAGLDMTMPGDTVFNSGISYWGTNLTLAVLNGTVPEYRIDDMAMRIMAAFFKVGMKLDDPEPNFSAWTLDTYGPKYAAANDGYQLINQHRDVRADHGKLIREVAAKGSVVLKNNGVLPLHKPKFVVVVGDDAGPNPQGPNGCPNRNCDNGTLGMAWGSGTAEFPYLVTPDAALQAQAVADGSRYESVLSNYQWPSTSGLVSQADATSIVFVNADSGEGFINIDGNEGDRKNLTLWYNGDDLIKNVSALCNNTIVVIHSTGPVLVTDWYQSPNISAIVWAGVPGQESGNSITDVLYGKVSPGRSPFSWGPTRESYGTDVMYKPNNGQGAPQDDFTEGVFIDYRYFDRAAPSSNSSASASSSSPSCGGNGNTGSNSSSSAAPIFEFGFGLSYTTFEFSNLVVQNNHLGAYHPTTGNTAAAPTFGAGNTSTNYSDYVFPSDHIRYIYQHIYPYLNVSDPKAASADPHYGETAAQFLPPGATDGSAQPKLAASGAPGGNPGLWDVAYTVRAQIKNTGSVAGDAVPQLYLGLGGPSDPVRVLRGFDRITIAPGQSATFSAELTRRDISNWDVASQNWVVSSYEKTVWVGSSSRDLPLSAPLK